MVAVVTSFCLKRIAHIPRNSCTEWNVARKKLPAWLDIRTCACYPSPGSVLTGLKCVIEVTVEDLVITEEITLR